MPGLSTRIEGDRVVADGVPVRLLKQASDLIIACLREWPGPDEVPEGLREPLVALHEAWPSFSEDLMDPLMRMANVDEKTRAAIRREVGW